MKRKGLISIILSFSLLITGTVTGSDNKKVKAADYGLSNPRVDSEGNVTWDCAYFGNYYQTAEWNKEPIKWRVLSVDENNNAVVVADKIIDRKMFNETYTSVTWENSTIRSWLNGYNADFNKNEIDYSLDNFIDEAFTENEQKIINTTVVVNNDNYITGADGGNDTEDKIFLLSDEEIKCVEYGFDKEIDRTRIAYNSEYVDYIEKIDSVSVEKENGAWWLRSQGSGASLHSYIKGDGGRNSAGTSANFSCYGIRPALSINLSSSDMWCDAGIIDSLGNDGVSDGSIDNPIIEDGLVKWDCIYFGNYYQKLKCDYEPIKWRVLSVDGDDAFFMAENSLDCMSYNKKNMDITWEKSTLRSWLNGYGSDDNSENISYITDNFIDKAFTEEEQKAINTSLVVNDDNPETGAEGGNDTKDKIYLLSMEEAIDNKYGFDRTFGIGDENYSKTRETKNTEYAKINGGYDSDEIVCWWLRTAGKTSKYACYVDTGKLRDDGIDVKNNTIGVRPVLHIDLSSPVWKKAGTVTSVMKNYKDVYEEQNPITTSKPGEITNIHNLSDPRIDSHGKVFWDCVYFGKYNQTFSVKKEPIKWRVLSVNGDDAFLLSDKILDYKTYNENTDDVIWEKSTIRSWLNGYDSDANSENESYISDNFIDKAFTEEEQKAIKTSLVVNDDNLENGAEGWNETEDKVYLLSIKETSYIPYGFDNSVGVINEFYSETRKAANTRYDKEKGAWSDSEGIGCWWLRSNGVESESASYVERDGAIDDCGRPVVLVNGVRPVLHIDLSSLVWENAGIVSSTMTNYYEESDMIPSPTPAITAEPITTNEPDNNYKLSNPRVDSEGNVTWDCAYFGNYYQTAEWNKEPIKWRVLSVDENNNALIVADKVLDSKAYNETTTNVTWKNSTLRSWLNGYNADFNNNRIDYSSDNFMDEAFTIDEQKAINNYQYESNIEDKLFLLSVDEVTNEEYGFESIFKDIECYEDINTRKVKHSEYAKNNGIHSGNNGMDYENYCRWWLRTSGAESNKNSVVELSGSINGDGREVSDFSYGVRPAININLSYESVWRDAGITDSEGNNYWSVDNKIDNPVIENGVTKWDCIYFGNYNQSVTWVKEPIKWRVLEVEGNIALFISDKILDCKPYTTAEGYVSWEKSTIRSWLNGYDFCSDVEGIDYQKSNFIDNSFTKQEKKAIITTMVNNSDIGDKLYLLSEEEAVNKVYGFDDIFDYVSDTRIAQKTDYANIKWDPSIFDFWWLRDVEEEAGIIASDNGWGDYTYVSIYGGVRPVLHINLSSPVWQPAGTVSSTMTDYEGIDEEEDTMPTPTPTFEATGTPSPEESSKPTDKPLNDIGSMIIPTITPMPVIQDTTPNQTIKPFETPNVAEKNKAIKLMNVKLKRNAKKITGKVSVVKSTVKIKVGSKAWKKANIKGKKFTLKTAKLKKNTKVQIKVSKKGYKTLIKKYKVK